MNFGHSKSPAGASSEAVGLDGTLNPYGTINVLSIPQILPESKPELTDDWPPPPSDSDAPPLPNDSDALPLPTDADAPPHGGRAPPKLSPGEVLLKLVETSGAEFFPDDAGEPYAAIAVDGHSEIYAVDS